MIRTSWTLTYVSVGFHSDFAQSESVALHLRPADWMSNGHVTWFDVLATAAESTSSSMACLGRAVVLRGLSADLKGRQRHTDEYRAELAWQEEHAGRSRRGERREISYKPLWS